MTKTYLDKRLKDFTPEEWEQFRTDLESRIGSDGMDSLKQFATLLKEIQELLNETGIPQIIDFIKGLGLTEEQLKALSKELNQPTETEEIEEVTLASYTLTSQEVNHSLAMKCLDGGLWAIAMGEPFHELKPRAKSKSHEMYKFTASEDACSRFFNLGGNSEIAKCVLETVHTLITDKRNEGFIRKGRIWFTVNTILQEMSRTSSGALKGKDSRKSREIVDSALLAASGGQIVGTDPAGNPLNTVYLIDAVRRDKAIYNKELYRGVWGFVIDASDVGNYAIEQGQSYNYPLLQHDKPLTLDEAWIKRYLIDALNEARGKLYTRGDNPRQTSTRKWVIKRSWPEIFRTSNPMKELSSRQKQSLVKRFQTILSKLAEMETHGENRKGRPVYIKAYSDRDAGRGRGKGAWTNLVIECYSDLKVADIGLL